MSTFKNIVITKAQWEVIAAICFLIVSMGLGSYTIHNIQNTQKDTPVNADTQYIKEIKTRTADVNRIMVNVDKAAKTQDMDSFIVTVQSARDEFTKQGLWTNEDKLKLGPDALDYNQKYCLFLEECNDNLAILSNGGTPDYQKQNELQTAIMGY